jgi:hypothetical protein
MVSNSAKPNTSLFALTEKDYLKLEQESYINRELVDEAGWWRADSETGAGKVGREPTAYHDYAGIIIEYYHPITGFLREYVLRRDNPDHDTNDKEVRKYLGPAGRTNMFFLPPGLKREWMLDVSIPIVFCEGEKKCLTLWRIARANMKDGKPLFIPIGLRGVWGWKGVTGNVDLPDGGHDRAKGPLNDFDFFGWLCREVLILFDSNIHSLNVKTRESIRAARQGLASHLQYVLEAKVFYAEMTREHFERGINGPDNIAAIDGPDAVLQLLDEASLAFKVKKYAPRETLSLEERKARADFLRATANKSAESKASDVLGSTTAKHLARLWAEANLSADSRDLLFTLETMAEGWDELEFYYSDLYLLLYKRSGNEFEQTPSGGFALKSSPRKRLRDRFEKLARDEAGAGITFADFTPGHQEGGENLPSHVRLLSRGYVAEVMIMAEEELGYSRHKKASRDRAFVRFVQEQSGRAYIHKHPKLKDRSKQIANGWRRVQGDIDANVKRMRQRGDCEEDIWETAKNFMPSEFLAYLKQKWAAEKSDLIKGIHEVTLSEGESPRPTSDEGSQQWAESSKRGDLENAASLEDSTNNSARFQKMRKIQHPKAADDPIAKAIWARASARAQGKPIPANGSPP